jgi:phage head maturation protease
MKTPIRRFQFFGARNFLLVTFAKADQQRRILFANRVEFAATPASDGQPAKLDGYPIIWGALSTDRGGYKVRLLKDSPTFSDPTDSYFEHDFRLLLGTTENATLAITPDDRGVRVTISLPDTSIGRDAFVLVRDKYVRGMSFAMVEAPWAIQGYTADGPQILPVPGKARVVRENGETVVEVMSGFVVDEVTITSRPAFVETTIGVAGSESPKPAYSARIAQAQQIERNKLEIVRLAGHGFARAAR